MRVVIQVLMCATRVITFALLISFLLGLAEAKDKKSYSRGVLAEMQSVSCGYMQKTGPTFAGAIITGAEHSKSSELLCQEYTLKTDRVTYRIRPKEEKHPALLPVGEEAEFRLKKDQMLLRVPESNDKEREYVVVSMAPTAEFASEIESTRRPPKPHSMPLNSRDEDTAQVAPGSEPRPSTNSHSETPAMQKEAGIASSAVAAAAPGGSSTSQQPTPTTASVSGTGSVQVQSTPSGAEVYVDSTMAGRTPATLTLKAGPHSIQIVMPGYKDSVTTVNLAPGGQQNVAVNLAR